MCETTEIRALTREEIEEAVGCLSSIEGVLGAMPYRDAVNAMALISTVRDIVRDCLPGGYICNCEACKKAMGADEVAGSDDESGAYFCASCTAQADKDEGWIAWDGGGPCPVEDGTFVDIIRRDGSTYARLRAGFQGLADRTFWRNMAHPSDIVRYRPSAPAADDRSDGGLHIQTKHLDIRNASEMPNG